jgi:hypothetical protein
MKPFDDKLADNVRETFDNWREQVPDGAWAKMSAKLDDARNPRVIPFWKKSGRVAAISLLAAATVALLMVPLIFLNNKTDSTSASSLSDISEELILTETEIEANPSIALKQNDILPEATGSFAKNEKQVAATKIPLQTANVTDPQKEDPALHQTEYFLVLNDKIDDQKTFNLDEVARITEKELAEISSVATGQIVETAFVPDVAENHPLDLFHLDTSRTNRFSWSVSASPTISFANNQPNPLPGLTAGVAAGYELSNRVRLEVGGLLSYNQVDIRNEATFSIVENFSNLYAGQDASAPRPLFSGNNKYNLLAVEIPANFQFSIFDGPGSKFFVSTGLSSLFFLHQSVSGVNYIHVQNDISGMPSGSQSFSSTTIFVDENYGPFSRIDLARILNLSAGYVFVGKKNSIVLEPFLKLPLGTISSSNLSLGMGGVSLKLLFSGN